MTISNSAVDTSLDRIERGLEFLEPVEREVLTLHLGLVGHPGLPLRAVAAGCHISTADVLRIEDRAFSKLRHPSMSVVIDPPTDR